MSNVVHLIFFQKRKVQRSSWRGFKLKHAFRNTLPTNVPKNKTKLNKDHFHLQVANESLDHNRCDGSKSSVMAMYACDVSKSQNSLNKNAVTDLQLPTEKSTLILVSIVLLFIITHSYRLALKMYEVLMPQGNTFESFKKCQSIGR